MMWQTFSPLRNRAPKATSALARLPQHRTKPAVHGIRFPVNRMVFCYAFSLAVATLPAWLTATAAYGAEAFRLEKLAEDLEVVWGIDFVSEDEMILTEKSGAVLLLNISTLKIDKLIGAPEVISTGQGGLLDVAVSPAFKETREIYFTYSKPVKRSGVTALARAVLEGNRLVQWRDVLVTDSLTDTNRHYGSRIAFDQANHIFFTVGDRGERPNAQNLKNHAGTVIRLNLDGTTPTDNPFIDSPTALPEIYSYGHRNPQGIAYDAISNRLWLIEHGPRGGDEINLIKPGKNYGWPVVSYGQEYYAPIPVGEAREKPGMESPVKVYIPSIAPGSLIVYSGKAFPQWQGCLFAGALKLRHLNRISVNNQGEAVEEERLLQPLKERVRDIAESPDGLLYFSTDSGKIYRITP